MDRTSVCHHFSEATISVQGDRQVQRHTDKLGKGWVGWGVGVGRLSRFAPLKVMSCLKLRTDDCRHSRKMCWSSRGKITIVFTCGHFFVLWGVSVLNDGRTTCLDDKEQETFIVSQQLLCVSSLACGSVLGVRGQPTMTQTEKGRLNDLRLAPDMTTPH